MRKLKMSHNVSYGGASTVCREEYSSFVLAYFLPSNLSTGCKYFLQVDAGLLISSNTEDYVISIHEMGNPLML